MAFFSYHYSEHSVRVVVLALLGPLKYSCLVQDGQNVVVLRGVFRGESLSSISVSHITHWTNGFLLVFQSFHQVYPDCVSVSLCLSY